MQQTPAYDNYMKSKLAGEQYKVSKLEKQVEDSELAAKNLYSCIGDMDRETRDLQQRLQYFLGTAEETIPEEEDEDGYYDEDGNYVPFSLGDGVNLVSYQVTLL